MRGVSLPPYCDIPFFVLFKFYQTSLLTLFLFFLLFLHSTHAAAIVRKVYLRQGTGVGALKNRFGGAYRRGARPEVHQDAAGGLIRNILTTLDDLKITEKSSKGGRKVTRTGQQALDLVAGQVARGEV
jgi:ribosomal protein S19E (S16A)